MLTKSKLVVGLIILVVIVYALFAFDVPYKNKIDDFATCVAAGNPVMESYPRQCRDKKGNTFTEVIGDTTTKSDMIHVTNPLRNASISSPVLISGEARGGWYFEASFPVQILGADGTVLASGPMQAMGDWMTNNFVPFSSEFAFNPGKNSSGVIRLMKDNPSGLPENDAHFDIPVTFKTATGTTAACKPTGCSSQICSDQDMASTCEFRSEYMCYRTAECKRQANGLCGWTQTATLTACLNNPPQQ